MSILRRVSLISAAAWLGLACSSSNLPVSPDDGPTIGLRVAKPQLANNSILLSLTDESGKTITLDEANRRLTLSNGQWVTLDSAMTELVLADFLTILETDSVVTSLAASVSTYVDPYANCNNGGQCEELRTPKGEAPTTARGARPYVRDGQEIMVQDASGLLGVQLARANAKKPAKVLIRKRVANSAPQKPKRDQNLALGTIMGGKSGNYRELVPTMPLGFDPQSLGGSSSGGMPGSSLRIDLGQLANVGDPCGDAINPILQAHVDRRNTRNTNLQRAWNIVIGEVVNRGLGSVLRTGTYAAAELGSIAVENWMLGVTSNVFGTFWAMMGCNDGHPINAGKVYSYGGSVSNPFVLWREVCHPEAWEISFDGGQTWAPIQVQVCVMVQE